MAFKFSLAAVLRIRVIVEEREERSLQKILYEIAQTVHAIDAVERQMAELNSSRRTELFKPLVVGVLNLSYQDMEALKQSRTNLQTRMASQVETRDRQVQVFEASRRDREMLSDMRAEKRTAYDFDLARREQKTLDDNYIARRGRS